MLNVKEKFKLKLKNLLLNGFISNTRYRRLINTPLNILHWNSSKWLKNYFG